MSLLKATTRYGVVTGKQSGRGAVSEFLGIPYAKPPVGELRYAAPQAPEAWDGEKACTEFGPSCIQPAPHGGALTYEISEDCLYLNVFTPAQRAGEKLPVLFWIYGGGFTGGSSADPEMSGERLCEKGVVVVTVNYRCGVMGFMALPELEQKNGRVVNAGILDQIAALHWVQENISAFGGDPARVLIFGQSAGGMSVRMLLTSPLTHGLFSRAVIHSGGGLNEADPIRPKQAYMDLCRKTMEYLGWTFADMMTRDAVEISEKMMKAVREAASFDEVGYFQPFLDEYSLLEVPGKRIARGEYPDLPILCGTVAGDSWMFSRKVRSQLPEHAYFRGFSYAPSQAWAQWQVKNGRTPIYTYYMERRQPPRPMTGFRRGGPPYGAETPHGSDVAYVFGTLDVRKLAYEPLDYEISEAMMTYWTNFAKTGNPNGAGLTPWPVYTAQTPYAMYFGNEGWKAENIVLSRQEQRTLEYTQAHPGLLTSLEGFFEEECEEKTNGK